MPRCAYCHTNASYQDRRSGNYRCVAHARPEITEPRRQEPREQLLTIRAAIPSDRVAIAELAGYFWGEVEVECFDRNYRVDALPAYVACTDSEGGDPIKEGRAAQKHDVQSDRIVGVAGYAREGNAVNLVLLNVLPRWQGLGAARNLIAAVVETAHADGAERVIVATTNDDLPALALYQRLGFTITAARLGKLMEHHGDDETGFAGIPVRDEIQMELRL